MQSFTPDSAPIVVDLDGTLIRTDSLVESFVRLARSSPISLLWAPAWVLGGRAALKSAIAGRVSLPAAQLPYCQPLLDYLRDERSRGRCIYLATAAHRSIANEVSAHLGLFDDVLATEGERNLKGEEKLAAIRARVGNVFVYAGDSRADVPVWKGAQAAILVGPNERLHEEMKATVRVEKVFATERAGLRTWLRALRAHQWLKNLLLFVPLVTAFGLFDPPKIVSLVAAFVAFSLVASATYLGNDLWDLDSDRAHPRKRRRPLAAGAISLGAGVAAGAGLLAAGAGLAAAVSPAFLAVLACYVVITTGYSWILKTYVLVDVLTLALLYTLRIVAGAVAIEVSVSSWLLAFSFFLFLSLALVKRCAELASLAHEGLASARGRDYRVGDLTVLYPLGVGAALAAIVVFGLFVSAPETRARYATPELLWLVAFGLTYWLARLWIKTSRGEMHDDPVVYALKDGASRLTFALVLAVVLIAGSVRIS